MKSGHKRDMKYNEYVCSPRAWRMSTEIWELLIMATTTNSKLREEGSEQSLDKTPWSLLLKLLKAPMHGQWHWQWCRHSFNDEQWPQKRYEMWWGWSFVFTKSMKTQTKTFTYWRIVAKYDSCWWWPPTPTPNSETRIMIKTLTKRGGHYPLKLLGTNNKLKVLMIGGTLAVALALALP